MAPGTAANPATGHGLDSWVMGSAFTNTVSGQGLPSESYRSKNLAGSLEGGYSFAVAAAAHG